MDLYWLISETNAIGVTKTNEYNETGLLTESTNGRNQKTKYTYDAIGRITSKEDETGRITYEYDKNGNVLKETEEKKQNTTGNIQLVSDKNVKVIKRTFDSRNRVTSYTDANGKTIRYGYDELGNILTIAYPGGETIRYTYYAGGQIATVTDSKGRVTYYKYDKTGNLTDTERPNGTKEHCEYNELGLLTSKKDIKTATGEVINEYHYKYDVRGNIVGVVDVTADTSDKSTVDTSAENESETTNGLTEDNNYTLPVPDTANKTALKLAAESNSIVTSDGETVTTSLEMEYDSANRLISYNNKKIKYDKDGNMLYGPVNGEMCNLTYDSRNRLISAGNVTYDYDAENTRISVTTTDKKITYVTDVAGEMSQVLESYEKTNDGKKTHTVYVYGNGLIYSYIDDGGDEADSITTDNKVQDLSSDKSSDKDADGTTYYHYNNIGSTTKLTDNNGNVIQSYEYGAYGEVLSGDTKITPFLYNGQLGVMTDNNGLYYMRARYYNVNIKRFINQDVVHGSINLSQSLNRYSYVQGNPIKLTDPFGLSPLDKINWRNVGHSALNILGCINGYGFIFDGINAVWYACEGDYGMAALSLISTLSDTGNMIAFGLKSTKFARVGQYIGAITQLVSNAATFTQAAISGLENAKAIFRNAKSGKLLSIDTASNVAALGLNLFTTIVSGKGAVTSGKNIKKMIGTDVGNKWGNKANNKPLLECNLQFFGDKNGSDAINNVSQASPFDLQATHSQKLSKKNMNKLIDDIKNNGINETIKYVEYNGQKYVVDGHHRLIASKRLGLEQVPIEQVELPYAGYKTVEDLLWFD